MPWTCSVNSSGRIMSFGWAEFYLPSGETLKTPATPYGIEPLGSTSVFWHWEDAYGPCPAGASTHLATVSALESWIDALASDYPKEVVERMLGIETAGDNRTSAKSALETWLASH
jgi:hypothetical protein